MILDPHLQNNIRMWALEHLAQIAEDIGNGEELGDPMDDLDISWTDPDYDEAYRQLRQEFHKWAKWIREGAPRP